MDDWLDYQLWPGPYLEPDYTWYDWGDGLKLGELDRSNVSTVSLAMVQFNMRYMPGDIYFTWRPDKGFYPAGFVVRVDRYLNDRRLELDVQWNDNY